MTERAEGEWIGPMRLVPGELVISKRCVFAVPSWRERLREMLRQINEKGIDDRD